MTFRRSAVLVACVAALAIAASVSAAQSVRTHDAVVQTAPPPHVMSYDMLALPLVQLAALNIIGDVLAPVQLPNAQIHHIDAEASHVRMSRWHATEARNSRMCQRNKLLRLTQRARIATARRLLT